MFRINTKHYYGKDAALAGTVVDLSFNFQGTKRS